MAGTTWTGKVENATFNADSAYWKRADERSAKLNTAKVNVKKSGSYNVVGINAKKVPDMREAIRKYVDAVEKHLNGVNELTKASSAYQSVEVQKAVQAYVKKMKEYCIGLTSQLLAFSDKIGDVLKTWEKRSTQMAADVGKTNTNFASTGKYTETIQ